MTSEPLTPEALDTIEAEEPLRIWWNKNLRHKISPAKLAAHAAHAALHAYGIEYTHPIVVLGAGKAKIEAMPITIHDAGLTELEPGTLTTGVESPRESAELRRLRTENEEHKSGAYADTMRKALDVSEAEVIALKAKIDAAITYMDGNEYPTQDHDDWVHSTPVRAALTGEATA